MGWADCGSWWLVGLLLASTKLLGAAGAIAWLPGQYPNPIKYPEACGRGDAVGWICDPDNVLPKEEADSVCNSIKAAHTCLSISYLAFAPNAAC